MFEWTRVHANEDGPPTCYRCDGVEVARITRKVDTDTWVAFLNQHRPFEPRVVRQCSSFEAGQRGVEQWAERHRERLEYEAGRINALRPKMPWLPKSPR